MKSMILSFAAVSIIAFSGLLHPTFAQDIFGPADIVSVTTSVTLQNISGASTNPNALADTDFTGVGPTYIEYDITVTGNVPARFMFEFDQDYNLNQIYLWNDRGQADSGIGDFSLNFFDAGGNPISSAGPFSPTTTPQGDNLPPEIFDFTCVRAVRFVELVSSTSIMSTNVQIREIGFNTCPCFDGPVPLDELILSGGVVCSGDKEFCEFSYSPIGDMPPASDILVIPTDGGIRFQGAFFDLLGNGASDALIEFKVKAPDGFVINSAQLAANPLVIGDGFFVVTETFLPTDTQTILSVYDYQPAGITQLFDEADLSPPVQVLCVQKDIIAFAANDESLAVMSFIDQIFECRPAGMLGDVLKGDANGDGVVDLLDVAAFVDAIQTGTFTPEADVNCDGVVDLLDVGPFVDLLTG